MEARKVIARKKRRRAAEKAVERYAGAVMAAVVLVAAI